MIQEFITLLIAVSSIMTGIFAEIRTTLIHEMRDMDLTIFSSLMRLETISDEKSRRAEKEIVKKYLSVSESYQLNATYMSFVALYALLCVVFSTTSLLFLSIAILEISMFFIALTILVGTLAALIYLGGRYRYFNIRLVEKYSWRLAELVIPNFAGGAKRDKDISQLIEKDVDIKKHLEGLEDNKHMKRLLSYSKYAIFP